MAGDVAPRPGGPRPDGPAVSPRAAPGIATVVVAVAVAVADVSAVNSVLPELRRDLGADASDLQWVVSGYVLTYGLAMIVTGRIGDARGRRPTFLTGVVVFTVASVLAAVAPGPGVLVVARLLQGFGAGFLNPQAMALVRELVPEGPRRSAVFALYTAVVGAALAVGPLLGGLLGSVGWRWVFWVNLPLGTLVLLAGLRVLPRAVPTGARVLPDVPGVALLWAGLSLLLIPLLELSDLPAGVVVAGLLSAVVALAAFVVRERRTAARGGAPVVDLALFRDRSYTCGVLLNTTYQAGLTGVVYVLTLYLRSGLGLDPVVAGAAQLPVALGALLVAPFAARLARPRRGELTGVILLVVGSAAAWAAVEVLPDAGTTIVWALAVPLLVVGVGSNLVSALNLGVTNARIPAEEAGSANALRQTTARIGSAVGTATVGALLAAALAPAGLGTAARADWDRAMSAGMALSVAFLAATLVPVLVDLVATRREVRAARS
ncbi:MFS transporter [Cellulomonas dongxiuzhuiae]|uniref:MFS transporter n=1 Tax=Cellulomonas dongxiuzhuiae TaxID=2819979 RepID=UPI002112817A|nr:MFS transporter [Cellulomonas dongxiuzhuiae]